MFGAANNSVESQISARKHFMRFEVSLEYFIYTYVLFVCRFR